MSTTRSLALVLAAALASGTTVAAGIDVDQRPELEVEGRISHLGVDPLGRLWFGTALGAVYRSADGSTWEAVDVDGAAERGDLFDRDHFDHVRFFDARRGLVAGYVGRPKHTVYRSDDGGASWSAVTLPESIWVYDVQVTADGRAWLVGSTGSLLFSGDFGRTWTVRGKPFSGLERSHAVHFAGRFGVVGALSDDLAATGDGGRTWSELATPKGQGLIGECGTDGRIEKVRLAGERLIVEQCGAVFAAAERGAGGWRELRSEGQPLVAFELHDGGVVAVRDDLEIVAFAADLGAPVARGYRLGDLPLSVAAGAGRVAILERDGRVTVGGETGFSSSRMFGPGVATSWPIHHLDRDAEGTLLGVSRHFVYRSPDGAESWRRLGELPQAVAGCAIAASGRLLVWDSHGWVRHWSPEEGLLEQVPGLDGLDVVGLFRRGPLWLAWGGLQHETTRRIEIARSFYSGQFAGSVEHGFVAASTDGGDRWTVVDRWPDGGPQALFLGEDDTLTLLSYLGAVRRGALRIDDEGRPSADLQTVLPATEETHDAVPYVEEAIYLEFLAGDTGWVHGWTHHLGYFVFSSRDGGRTWKRRTGELRQFASVERLGGGAWVALRGPSTLLIWEAQRKRWKTLRELPGGVEWWRVDATGALLLQLEDAALYALSPDGDSWTRLSGVTALASPPPVPANTAGHPMRLGSGGEPWRARISTGCRSTTTSTARTTRSR